MSEKFNFEGLKIRVPIKATHSELHYPFITFLSEVKDVENGKIFIIKKQPIIVKVSSGAAHSFNSLYGILLEAIFAIYCCFACFQFPLWDTV